MRYITFIFAMTLLVSPAASAQMRHQGMMQDSSAHYHTMSNMPMNGPMMRGNMNGMMGNSMMCGMNRGMMDGNHHGFMGTQMPMHKYMMIVNLLPSMQDKLSLTDDQTSKLIDLQAAYTKEQAGYKADLAKQMIKLRTLLNNNATSAEVKKVLESCSETRINMQVAAYDASRNMTAVLNPDQKKSLDGMKMPWGEGHTMNW